MGPSTKVKPINPASTYMYPFGVRHAKCYPKLSVRTGQIDGLDLRTATKYIGEAHKFGQYVPVPFGMVQHQNGTGGQTYGLDLRTSIATLTP
jgi:hypothetical protein